MEAAASIEARAAASRGMLAARDALPARSLPRRALTPAPHRQPTESSTLSASNCPPMRPRPAPKAMRIAISPPPRAIAAREQQIGHVHAGHQEQETNRAHGEHCAAVCSTDPDSSSRKQKGRRAPATIQFGDRLAPADRRVASISARTCASLTPGRHARDDSSGSGYGWRACPPGSMPSGIQTSAGLTSTRNPAGSTPTTGINSCR